MSLTLNRLEKQRNLQPFGSLAATKAVFCSLDEHFLEISLHFQQETGHRAKVAVYKENIKSWAFPLSFQEKRVYL